VVELEVVQARVVLVDLGVADVDPAGGVEAGAHLVEAVLVADEVDDHAVALPQLGLVGHGAVGGAADHGAARLLVEDGRAAGVETVSGRRIRAGAVLAACHVGTTRTLAGDHAPPALADADPPLGNGFGLVVRALTDAIPGYPGVPGAVSSQGLQLLCTHRADLAAAHGDWAAGRLPRAPVPLAMSFSAGDDTLAPPGQHVVTIWGQWYPYTLADGGDWDALAETEAARLIAAVERFAPGFADSVQRLYVQTPLQLERELSLPRGNVMHVEMGLASMFGVRPTPALSGYTVPGLPGLYLAGASTHPGGGVSGHSGRSAARVLLAGRRPAARPRAAVGAAVRRAGRFRS
jgi:phytoene dehydrogenase-like protein